jgi:hypothetical protein
MNNRIQNSIAAALVAGGSLVGLLSSGCDNNAAYSKLDITANVGIAQNGSRCYLTEIQKGQGVDINGQIYGPEMVKVILGKKNDTKYEGNIKLDEDFRCRDDITAYYIKGMQPIKQSRYK